MYTWKIWHTRGLGVAVSVDAIYGRGSPPLLGHPVLWACT